MERTNLSSKSLVEKLFFVVVIIFLSSHVAWGGQWAKIYGGEGNDYASAIQQTVNLSHIVNGYMAAGAADSFGNGNFDSWVVKLDLNGNIVWQRAYGGAGDDYATALQQTSNAGYIVVNKTNSFGTGRNDIWLLRFYSDGVMQWQKTYGGTGDDSASAIEQTSDGGFIMAGSTDSFGAGSNDAWALKLNYNGNVQWQKTYGGTGDDSASAIQQTSDGGYIMAGSTNSFGAGGRDLWVLKTNSTGTVQWQKTYGGVGDDYANSIQQTKSPMNMSDGYVIAGTTYSFGAGSADAWVLKLDLNGAVVWQKSNGNLGDDLMHSIQQTSDGGYIAAGSTTSLGTELMEFLVLKLDSRGNIIWQKTYSEGETDSASFIRQTSDDGYIAAGRTNAGGTGGSDFLVVSLHGNGDIADCTSIKTADLILKDTAALVNTTTVTGISSSVSAIARTVSKVVTDSTAKLLCDAGLTLYSPRGGEVIPSGSIYAIEWGAGIDPVKFDLFYSMDAGATWIPIANSVKGMKYEWQVPILSETKDTCLIKVTGYDMNDLIAGEIMTEPFAIAVLDIIQPNGGEALKSGTVYLMQWDIAILSPIAKENLYYTDDGGDSWKLITTRMGSSETYPWEVPWVTNTKTNCKVKIDLLDTNGRIVGTDTSDAFFTIQPVNLPPVTVVSPNGGETLTSGMHHNIIWETNSALSVEKAVLYYSTNGGTTWTKIIAISGNPGIYFWTVPAVNSEMCKIKVVLKDAVGTMRGTDISDGNFAILY